MGFRLEEEAYFQNESSLETQDEDCAGKSRHILSLLSKHGSKRG